MCEQRFPLVELVGRTQLLYYSFTIDPELGYAQNIKLIILTPRPALSVSKFKPKYELLRITTAIQIGCVGELRRRS